MLTLSLLYAFAWQQIAFEALAIENEPAYFIVAPGTSLSQLTRQLNKQGILAYPSFVRWYAVSKGYANSLQSGEYKIMPGTTPKQMLKMVVNGQVTQYAFTIVEGWKSADLIEALNEHPKIKHELKGLSDQEIIKKLAIPNAHLEGIFLPDTYYFHAYTSDLDFLKRSYVAMQQAIQVAWDNRSKTSVLRTPYEALILASIIEKESGVLDEYRQISGVYQRRLAKNMRLQADPTVAYFWGDKLPQGKLFFKHLKIDSPYNTYTRHGLPPTPIALAGIKALEAALNPAAGETLYFVATGTGGHVFTRTLQDHNKEVIKFRKRSSSNK